MRGGAQLKTTAWREGLGPSRSRRREIDAEARRIRLRGKAEGWARDAVVDEMLRQLPDVTPLEAHRFAERWTREELSQQVDRLYIADELEPPQLTSAELCRWEHGQRRPSDERREYLCRVYRTRPDRLGFGSDHSEGPQRSALLRRREPGGDLAPDAGPAVLPSDGIPVKLTAPIVEGLEAITSRYRALYWTLPAAHLLRPAVGHLGLGITLLRNSTGPPPLRRRATLAAAETALLAGRALFFDLRRAGEARGCLRTALDLALDASDHALAAAVLAHIAFIPGFAGDLSGAQDCIHGARIHARRGAAVDVQAWLSAAESEVCARGGDVPSSVMAVLRAEEQYEGTTDANGPPWFDWFSPEHLASFAGYAHLRAGDLPAARGRLASALSTLPHGAKQRAVLLADMAGVEVARAEVEEACRLLVEALSDLSLTGYATGFERVREVRSGLEGWRDAPAVRDLDEIMYRSRGPLT
jgi:hypothetical protein